MNNILLHKENKEEKFKKQKVRINPNSIKFKRNPVKSIKNQEEIISTNIQRNCNNSKKDLAFRKNSSPQKYENKNKNISVRFSEKKIISSQIKKEENIIIKNDLLDKKEKRIDDMKRKKTDYFDKFNNDQIELNTDDLNGFNEKIKEEILNDSLNDSLSPELESANLQEREFQIRGNEELELSEIHKLENDLIIYSDPPKNNENDYSNLDLIQIKKEIDLLDMKKDHILKNVSIPGNFENNNQLIICPESLHIRSSTQSLNTNEINKSKLEKVLEIITKAGELKKEYQTLKSKLINKMNSNSKNLDEKNKNIQFHFSTNEIKSYFNVMTNCYNKGTLIQSLDSLIYFQNKILENLLSNIEQLSVDEIKVLEIYLFKSIKLQFKCSTCSNLTKTKKLTESEENKKPTNKINKLSLISLKNYIAIILMIGILSLAIIFASRFFKGV